jgi:4'-phosphopantetheinyl transferase
MFIPMPDVVMALTLPEDIHCHRLEYAVDCREQWLSYLSVDEREQMEQFGSEKRRREFLLGRAALRILLGRHLEVPPASIPLYQADDGAPEVAGSGLQISLTHSHGWAAAVLAGRAVGVDMEYIQPRHEELYRQILHTSEMEMFNALPPGHDERQILCWTLKEATLKAVRPEHHLSMKHLRIDCTYDRRTADVRLVNLKSSWTVSFDRVDDFYVAVAYPAG